MRLDQKFWLKFFSYIRENTFTKTPFLLLSSFEVCQVRHECVTKQRRNLMAVCQVSNGGWAGRGPPAPVVGRPRQVAPISVQPCNQPFRQSNNSTSPESGGTFISSNFGVHASVQTMSDGGVSVAQPRFAWPGFATYLSSLTARHPNNRPGGLAV